MLEEEFYKKNRDKIDLNDISTWKYFPVGEPMRKTYDYHNLRLSEYLDRYYKRFENIAQWEKNWMQDIVIPLFNNEPSKWKRIDFKRNNTGEYISWFKEKHHRVTNSFSQNKSLKFFERDIVQFFSYLEAFDFFKDCELTLNQWINTKDFNLGGRHKVEPDIYSLNVIAKEKFGNNLIRDKLMSLEWHKR